MHVHYFFIIIITMYFVFLLACLAEWECWKSRILLGILPISAPHIPYLIRKMLECGPLRSILIHTF